MQTILLKTRQMKQTLMVDFLDTQTSILTRVDNGLATIIGLAKNDIQEPMLSALNIADDMYNRLAKPNIDIISRALARETAALSWIEDFLQKHHQIVNSPALVQCRRMFGYYQGSGQLCQRLVCGTLRNCAIAVKYSEIEPESDLFSKLHHFLTEAIKEFEEMEKTLNRASHSFSTMLSTELRNNHLNLIQEVDTVNNLDVVYRQTHVGAFCSASIADFLKLNKQFAEVLAITNLTGLEQEQFGSRQMQLLSEPFYPSWNQFESTSGSMLSCLRGYPNLIARTSDWVLHFDLDVNQSQCKSGF